MGWLINSIAWTGLLLGIGVFVVLLIVLIQPQKCPGCGRAIPKFRRSKAIKRADDGNWICLNCGYVIGKDLRKTFRR